MFFIPSSLQIFPEEILLMIFMETDIPTLLSLSNVCKKFKRLANICLSDKFKEQNVGLILSFGQEHKLRSNVIMKFHHVNEKNGNFVFQPKEDVNKLKFYHSPMLKNPKLYKIVPENNNNQLLSKDGNLLQKSVGIPIKSREGNFQKIQTVFRTGNVNSHLKVFYKFIYSVIDIPPPCDIKSRGGERWITPLSFECPPSFFYPNGTVVRRILNSVINYKPNKNPVVSNLNIKQLILNNIQESQIQEQQSSQIEVTHEKRKSFIMPLVSSRRFNCGARC